MARSPNASMHTAPLARSRVSKAFGWFGWACLAVGMALAFIPVIGPGLSHFVDRFKNRRDAKKELRSRADWYRDVIGRQLGIDPATVNEKDLLLAAEVNPELARAVEDVYRKQKDENRSSLMINAGATAVSWVPGAGAAIKAVGETHAAAKMIAEGGVMLGGGVAGGMFAKLFTKDRIDPQEVADAIADKLVEAQEKGIDGRKAIHPRMVFMLHATKDVGFNEHLMKTYGKPFHKMSEGEQDGIMQAYPALANASTAEAYAVGSGMMTAQELVASKPNLNGSAQRYAVGERNASFAQRIENERALAAGKMAPAV